jgi:tetratricopeptide (TPR) repeat protein
MTYEKLGDYNYACSLYNNYLLAQQDATVYNQLGMCRMQMEDYEAALTAFQEGMKMENCPCMQSLKFNEIVAYEYLGEYTNALVLLEKQLKYTEPTFVKTWRGGGTYPNLFCAHPPFQIDGNFGFVSGVLEMLVDVRNGQLCLLPALPDKWKKGSLTGVRIKGGKILDIAWEDGKLVYVKERGKEDECK